MENISDQSDCILRDISVWLEIDLCGDVSDTEILKTRQLTVKSNLAACRAQYALVYTVFLHLVLSLLLCSVQLNCAFLIKITVLLRIRITGSF